MSLSSTNQIVVGILSSGDLGDPVLAHQDAPRLEQLPFHHVEHPGGA